MTNTEEDEDDTFAAIKESVADSSKDWQLQLVEKYCNVYTTCIENLPGLWDSIEFIISVQKILNIADCTLPFAGIVLGSPSSLKTVGIELSRRWNNVFYTDSFSAKSFVSHSTAVKKNELASIDMLPKIKNKFFLTPELSPTFAKKDDDLIEILGILTRVLDGHGYESDTGAHGYRGYNEKIMFPWIGAAVDIPWRVHKALGNLGAKLYFLRLPKSDKTEDNYFDELDKDFGEKVSKISSALLDYLEWFDTCPHMLMDEESGLSKMSWNPEIEDSLPKRYLIRLGRLLAHLRGVVNTWETHDISGTGYGYTFATIEEPDRAIIQLRNLARGHALLQGRNYITVEDIRIVIKVVFSTADMAGVRIFELLLQFKGRLNTSQITASLNIVNNTDKRTMTEFKALGLVTLNEGENENSVKEIILHKNFEWFLTEDFKLLSQKIPPTTTSLSEKNLTTNVHNNRDRDKDKEGLEGCFYDSEAKDMNPPAVLLVFPPKCYRCDFSNFNTKGEYDYHCLTRHPGLPAYPGPADIRESGLTPQGMPWER